MGAATEIGIAGFGGEVVVPGTRPTTTRGQLVGRPGAISLIEWFGEAEEGRRTLGALQAELAAPASSLQTVPFLEIQTMTEEIFAHGKRTYIKAGVLDEFPPEVIDVLAAHGCQVGAELGMPVGWSTSRRWGGPSRHRR